MSLSVCLLTRNEEKNIAGAVNSVAGVADEVIVADTGSTDRTVAVAAQLGAKISVVSWQDDFGAARNLALDQATGDWILWLNPDEELLPESRVRLPQYLGREDILAYAVSVQEVPRGDQLDSFTLTEQVRLFRRRRDLRFVGRLHPRFGIPLAELAEREGKRLTLAEVTLRHHAYLSVLTAAKLRWANNLLELELRDRPGQLHYLVEYGRNLLRLNDVRGHAILAQGAEQLLAARTDPVALAPDPAAGPLLEYLLTVAPVQSQSRLTAAEAADLAVRWFPHSPPLVWAVAQYYFHKEDFPRAAVQLEKLVLFGQRGVYDRSAAFDPTIIGDPAVMNLGSCCVRLGMLDRAQQCFQRLLPSERYHGQAAQNLALLETLRSQKVSSTPPGSENQDEGARS